MENGSPASGWFKGRRGASLLPSAFFSQSPIPRMNQNQLTANCVKIWYCQLLVRRIKAAIRSSFSDSVFKLYYGHVSVSRFFVFFYSVCCVYCVYSMCSCAAYGARNDKKTRIFMMCICNRWRRGSYTVFRIRQYPSIKLSFLATYLV